MSLEDIIARNKRDRKAGIKRTYPQHAGKAQSHAPGVAQIAAKATAPRKAISLPCVHVGPDSGPKGWHYCEHPDTPLGDVVCSCKGCGVRCAGYSAIPAPLQPTTNAAEPFGVVIGSYKWPELIDLQCRVIRATCGVVPILVSSDHPESNPALSAICSRHPDVTLWPNPERIGHTGGDIAAFWKGVTWGASRGLKVVAKLSQRFVVTRPRWLQDGAADLLAAGLPLATRTCRGTSRWPLRTEACLLDVRQWNSPAVLDRIKPRRYWTDSPQGLSAETVVQRVLEDLLGGIFWPWSLFTEEKRQRHDGVIWHDSDTLHAYRSLAEQHGVTLPPDFTTDGWQHELRRGEYVYG